MTPDGVIWLGAALWLREQSLEWVVREYPDQVVAVAEVLITVRALADAAT